MPQSYVSRRTSTPDALSGNVFAVIASHQDATILFPAGLLAQNIVGDKPAVHRSGISTVDANTDMSTGDFATSLYELHNDTRLMVWGESTVTLASITVIPIYYDQSNRPLFEGPALSLGSTPRRVAAAGNYFTCLQQLAPIPGTDRVKLFVSQLSAGTWNLYLASV